MKKQWKSYQEKVVFRSEQHVKSICLKMKNEINVFLEVLEQIEKTMPKGTSKVIVNAERNRRTL